MAIIPSPSSHRETVLPREEAADVVDVKERSIGLVLPHSIHNGPVDMDMGDKKEQNHNFPAVKLSFNPCCNSNRRIPTNIAHKGHQHLHHCVSEPTILACDAGLYMSSSSVGNEVTHMEGDPAAATIAAPPASFALAVASGATHQEVDLKGRGLAVEGGDASLKLGEGNSTFMQATFNCTSLLLGLGILSSPYAMAQAGWLGGAISLIVAGTYAYAAQLLIRCQEYTGCGTYQQLAKLAVGRKTKIVIEAFFYMEITGSLLGYCISVADNLEHIFPTAHLALPGLNSRNVMLLVACLCVLPTVWLQDLSSVSFTSVWSIVSTILLFIAVMLAATVVDHIGFRHAIPLAGIRGAPVAAGLYAFAYGGTTVFPSVYTSMRDPSRFTQALLLSFAIATTFVCGLGVAGAYMFGKETASQITLSMPSHRITTKIVLWMTVLTPMLKFALVLSPVSTAMDIKLRERFKDYSPRAQLGITTLMRSAVMALIVIGAMVLPYFNYVIALIGSSITIAICLIFPCVFYVKLCRHRLTRGSFALILFVGVFAGVAAVCGTIISFQGLIDSKTNHTS